VEQADSATPEPNSQSINQVLLQPPKGRGCKKVTEI